MANLVGRLRQVVDPVDSVHPGPPEGSRPAAVLLLFDARDPRLPLLFLERTAHLRHHAGQIGFPGGGSEPHDASTIETALREATEEAGIRTADVEVIGVLPPFLTATSGRWLTPVIGLQSEEIELRPDAFEVARLFRVTLQDLIDAPHTVRRVNHDGMEREVHFYEADGGVIWGVTGAIVAELISRIQGAAAQR